MKIAISSQNKRTVTGHPGKCRKFWVYSVLNGQIQNRTLLELSEEQMFHNHPKDQSHPLHEVDVLISGMMAVWLQEWLSKYQVKALATSETDLDQTVDLYLKDSLPLIPVHGGHNHGVVNQPS